MDLNLAEFYRLQDIVYYLNEIPGTDRTEEQSKQLLAYQESLNQCKTALGNRPHEPGGGTPSAYAPQDVEKWPAFVGVAPPLQTDDVCALGARPFSQQLQQSRAYNSFTKEISNHCDIDWRTCRGWLYAEVSAWLSRWEGEEDKDRIFWLRAGAGMGKSAFATSLVKHLESQNIFLGAVFCKFCASLRDDFVIPLSVQCAANLPETKSDIETAIEASEFDYASNVLELFRVLLMNPLKEYSNSLHPHPHPRQPMVIVIDALDEISTSAADRSELLLLLKDYLAELPSWVRVLVTSRPESDIVQALACCNSVEVLESDPRHVEDLRGLTRSKVVEFQLVKSLSDIDAAVEVLLKKSQGNFLYMTFELSRHTSKRYDLDELRERLPSGLVGCYNKYFQERHDAFSTFHLVVRLIVMAAERVSIDSIQAVLESSLFFGATGDFASSMAFFKSAFHDVFTVEFYNDELCIAPFHKSVLDWLESEQAESFRIDNLSWLVDIRRLASSGSLSDAIALCELSLFHKFCPIIGSQGGIIPIVNLSRSENSDNQDSAATALMFLSIYHSLGSNTKKIVEAGGIPALINLARPQNMTSLRCAGIALKYLAVDKDYCKIIFEEILSQRRDYLGNCGGNLVFIVPGCAVRMPTATVGANVVLATVNNCKMTVKHSHYTDSTFRDKIDTFFCSLRDEFPAELRNLLQPDISDDGTDEHFETCVKEVVVQDRLRIYLDTAGPDDSLPMLVNSAVLGVQKISFRGPKTLRDHGDFLGMCGPNNFVFFVGCVGERPVVATFHGVNCKLSVNECFYLYEDIKYRVDAILKELPTMHTLADKVFALDLSTDTDHFDTCEKAVRKNLDDRLPPYT